MPHSLVTPLAVDFKSQGLRIAAHLYLPSDPGTHPCVVMAGGWCYVKELAQPAYASVFARRGLAALVFDYRHFGESEGEPRQHIDPWAQIEDYRNAISFAAGLDEIDASCIAAWGISYSGGHVLILGATDRRVRAVCSVVPVIDGYASMRLSHGTLGLRRLLTELESARKELYVTGKHRYMPHQPASEGEIGTWPFPKSRETFARLKATLAPRYEGRATAASTEMLLAYSVGPFMKRLVHTPTLMVVAEGDDHTHWDLAADAYADIPGDRKRFDVVPRSTHLTLYEDDETLAAVAETGADWFLQHLRPAGSKAHQPIR
jgi:alpha-beta hydrolase superfamily lysophospholipase